MGAVAGDPTATGTIVNDDVSTAPVHVALSGGRAALENAGFAGLTMSFSRAVPTTSVLTWSTRRDGGVGAATCSRPAWPSRCPPEPPR